MCGRYSLTTPISDLETLFEAIPSHLQDFQPNRNVTPGSVIPVIAFGRDRVTVLTSFRWGMTPGWATQTSTHPVPRTSGHTQLLINARSETVHQKPSFAHSFGRYRCIIPANGFYEWKPGEYGKPKTPWLIDRTDEDILAMAGIFQRQKISDDAVQISCAILTTKANAKVAEVHDRMPVILERSQISEWIHPDSNPAHLRQWFDPLPAECTSLHEGVNPATA